MFFGGTVVMISAVLSPWAPACRIDLECMGFGYKQWRKLEFVPTVRIGWQGYRRKRERGFQPKGDEHPALSHKGCGGEEIQICKFAAAVVGLRRPHTRTAGSPPSLKNVF